MRSPSIGRVNTTRPSLGFSFLPPPPSLALISPPIPWVTAPGADVGWKNNSSPAVGDGEGGGGGGGGEPTREPEGVVGRGGGLGDAPHQEGRGRGGEWGCAAPARGGGTDRAAAAPSGGTWGVRGHGDSVGIGGYGERGGIRGHGGRGAPRGYGDVGTGGRKERGPLWGMIAGGRGDMETGGHHGGMGTGGVGTRARRLTFASPVGAPRGAHVSHPRAAGGVAKR